MEDVHAETEPLRGAGGALCSSRALNTALHETQREVSALERQVRAKDTLVAELRARLARYEQPRAEDPVQFAPSAGLVDNLCREIGRLKQTLKETEAQADASRAEVQQLRQRVSKQEQEMVALMHRPGHEKDLEIQQLRLTLQERDRVQATKDVLCTSLTEEVEQLKLQLGATVRVCQGLLKRFDREMQRHDLAQSPSRSLEGGKLVELQVSTQANSVESKLKEENQQLKQRVAYVESLNAKWQKYDSSREEYVKALCLKLKEVSAQATLGLAPANGGLLQQEISRLNRLLEEKMADCSRLSRELEEVRRVDEEHIQMLEHQVVTYVDDFNSERADRERAQSKIQSLQEKVDHLQQQLHGQDPRDSSASCRAHGTCRAPSRTRADTTEPLVRSSGGGGGSSHPRSSRSPGPSTQGSGRTERRDPAELQCPHCRMTYRSDRTEDRARHFQECDRS